MQVLEKIMEEIKTEKKKHWDPADESDKIIGWCFDKCMDIVRNHLNDGWIPVEERLPDKEADKFIKEKLDGIGYLYPCLLTYRSPNTERIHVVRFYYDVYERWFVNAGEELCDKDRCIAWRPLPEPYRPERSEK